MKLLTRDDILKCEDLPVEEVEVPEWGGAVRVRGLTAAERDAYQLSLVVKEGEDPLKKMANCTARVCHPAFLDEEGKPAFTPADVEALGLKSGAALNRVWLVVKRLSGLGEGAVEAAKAELKRDPSEGSSSA